MKLIVTGGCGYKGSVLVPKLLAAGHRVGVYDVQWFGMFLTPHPALTVHQKDVRDLTLADLQGVGATMQLADMAIRAGVKQFN